MVRMKNKKGWLRIVEAFIAIILITGVMLSIYSVRKVSSGNEIVKIQDAILNEISQSENLRNDVINSHISSLNAFVEERIPSILEFSIKICEVDDVCNLDEYRKDTYVRERVISSTLEEYSPKKIKLFVWEK